MSEGPATNGNALEKRADFWTRLFSRVGFPTAVAIALGWGIWHSLTATAAWAKPIIESQLLANATLQAKLVVSLDVQEKLIGQQNVILEKIVDLERQSLERISRLEDRLSRREAPP